MKANARVIDAKTQKLKRTVRANRDLPAISSRRSKSYFGGTSPSHMELLADLRRMHVRLNRGFAGPI
ncbi:MAG TPA: hypothetical protein PKA31_02115 [Candidatus Moranbacteria bacterium]|nr:hypothetical protein [Candidatus Moranbacteria bacterium]